MPKDLYTMLKKLKTGEKGTDAIYDSVGESAGPSSIIRKRLWKIYRKVVLGEKVGDD